VPLSVALILSLSVIVPFSEASEDGGAATRVGESCHSDEIVHVGSDF
jgi:hypothetical protein